MSRTPRFGSIAAVALWSGICLNGAPVPGNQGAQGAQLRVGAARVDITPPPPEGNTIRDRLYASAIVIDNGTTRAALIGADQISFNESAWADATARLAADFKIPPVQVLTTATHAHSDGRFGVAPPAGGPGRGGAPAARPASTPPRQSSALADSTVEAPPRSDR